MSSLNRAFYKGDICKAPCLYLCGYSLTDIAGIIDRPISKVRKTILPTGIMRSRKDATDIAVQKGKFYTLRGIKKNFTPEWCANIKKGKQKWGAENGKGYTVKSDGRIEYTRGEHKFRGLHVIEAEQILGRRLKSGECVHHIDGNKSNNKNSNLIIMTCSSHVSLHRRQEIKNGITRRRLKNGRFA